MNTYTTIELEWLNTIVDITENNNLTNRIRLEYLSYMLNPLELAL